MGIIDEPKLSMKDNDHVVIEEAVDQIVLDNDYAQRVHNSII